MSFFEREFLRNLKENIVNIYSSNDVHEITLLKLQATLVKK